MIAHVMFAWTMILAVCLLTSLSSRSDRLFKREPQSLGLASHPKVTIVVFARIVVHDSGESITESG